MTHVEPLSFTDPAIERRTYVDAMVKTVIDHRTDFLDEQEVAIILLRAGWRPKQIEPYLDDVCTRTVSRG